MAFTDNNFDVTIADQKRIVINPGVQLDIAKKVLVAYLADHWVKAKEVFKEFFKEHHSLVDPGFYKELGASYQIGEIMYFIYPTKISFVISRKEHMGFKKLE